MAKLSRGITFATNDFIVAARLHALIDTAIAGSDAFPGTPAIYDLVRGDTLSCEPFLTQDSPASPATNDIRVGPDYLIDRHDGSSFVDITNDYSFLINNAINLSGTGITLATGNPVVIDTASAGSCVLWPGDPLGFGVCNRPFGIVVSVAAPGATAKVQYRGIAPALVANPSFVDIDSRLRIVSPGATLLALTSSGATDYFAVVVAVDLNNILDGKVLVNLVH